MRQPDPARPATSYERVKLQRSQDNSEWWEAQFARDGKLAPGFFFHHSDFVTFKTEAELFNFLHRKTDEMLNLEADNWGLTEADRELVTA